jgi:hypothetical protein
MTGRLVNNDLEGMRKEAIATNLRYNSNICSEGLRKTMKILSQDSWCPSKDSNRAPPKFKVEVLTA